MALSPVRSGRLLVCREARRLIVHARQADVDHDATHALCSSARVPCDDNESVDFDHEFWTQSERRLPGMEKGLSHPVSCHSIADNVPRARTRPGQTLGFAFVILLALQVALGWWTHESHEPSRPGEDPPPRALKAWLHIVLGVGLLGIGVSFTRTPHLREMSAIRKKADRVEEFENQKRLFQFVQVRLGMEKYGATDNKVYNMGYWGSVKVRMCVTRDERWFGTDLPFSALLSSFAADRVPLARSQPSRSSTSRPSCTTRSSLRVRRGPLARATTLIITTGVTSPARTGRNDTLVVTSTTRSSTDHSTLDDMSEGQGGGRRNGGRGEDDRGEQSRRVRGSTTIRPPRPPPLLTLASNGDKHRETGFHLAALASLSSSISK